MKNKRVKGVLEIVMGLSIFLAMYPSIKMMAADLKTIETDWTPMQYAASTSALNSTHTVTGLGVSWMIYPVGSSVTYQIGIVTGSIRSALTGYTTYYVDTSSPAAVLAGNVISGTWKFPAVNPKFNLTGLSANSTVYIYIDYGRYKLSY